MWPCGGRYSQHNALNRSPRRVKAGRCAGLRPLTQSSSRVSGHDVPKGSQRTPQQRGHAAIQQRARSAVARSCCSATGPTAQVQGPLVPLAPAGQGYAGRPEGHRPGGSEGGRARGQRGKGKGAAGGARTGLGASWLARLRRAPVGVLAPLAPPPSTPLPLLVRATRGHGVVHRSGGRSGGRARVIEAGQGWKGKGSGVWGKGAGQGCGWRPPCRARRRGPPLTPLPCLAVAPPASAVRHAATFRTGCAHTARSGAARRDRARRSRRAGWRTSRRVLPPPAPCRTDRCSRRGVGRR